MVSALKRIGLFSIVTLLLIPFSSTSFGQEPPSDYSFWQLVYISSDRCIFPDEQKIIDYSKFVKKYFELYEFENYGFEPKCLSLLEYFDYQKPYSVDLVILVLDNYLGSKLLNQDEIKSLYAHFGMDRSNNHVIIVTEPTDYDTSLDSTTISWDKSHQLSHFILSFKGYNDETIERLLHSNSLSFEHCVGQRISDSKCDEVRTYMRIEDSSRNFVVMTPFKELIGNGLTKYISEDVISSKVVLNLHREITTWWINGLIDDQTFLKATKHLVDVPIIDEQTTNNQIIKLPNGFIILDKAVDANEEFKVGPFNAYATRTTVGDILLYVPFETEFEIIDEKPSEIPNWFKQRAKNWSENKLGDKIFYDGLEALIKNGILIKN